jgi:serine/threonine kinase 32
MQRRSYYPHNQQLISTATATSSGLASSRPETPANDLRPEHGVAINGESMELQGPEAEEMNKEITEKEYR